MIEPGTKIKFKWDNYEIYYNTEYEYLGTETKYGIVQEYDNNSKEEQRLKQQGLLKVLVPKEAKDGYPYGIYWISADDKSIVVLTKWMKFKRWLKKHFGYKIKIYILKSKME